MTRSFGDRVAGLGNGARVLALRSVAVVAFLMLPFQASAQVTKPQVWTTNVVAGEFPSQQAALAAVRAQGGVYALAEKVEDPIIQTEQLTTYIYGAIPRGPFVGEYYKFTLQGCSTLKDTEEAGIQCAIAESPSSPTCPATTYVASEAWRPWQYFSDRSTTKIDTRFYDLTRHFIQQVNGLPTCVADVESRQGWRERIVECQDGLTWNSTEGACVRHDIARIRTKPMPCPACDFKHNPVSVSTGGKFQSEGDLTLPWLTFFRHYHSTHTVPGARLGPGWTHDLNIRLYLNGTSGAGVVMPSGAVLPFRYISGQYEATDGSGWRIRNVSGYQLEKPSQTVKFNASGRPTVIEELTGDALSLLYDADGRLASATHSTGRSITFEYDANPISANALLAAIKLDDAALVNYQYDSAGRLEYAQYPNGTARRYHYEDATYPNHLTGITDETESRYSTYGYNAEGYAVLSEHAGSQYRGTFDYRADGSTVYTDANGQAHAFDFSADGAYRKITQTADSDGTESITYALANVDFRRRPINRIDKRGVQTTYSYADISDAVLGSVRRLITNEAVGTPQARTTQTYMHLMRPLPAERRTYDAAGVLVRKEVWTYNSRGQVLTHSVDEP